MRKLLVILALGLCAQSAQATLVEFVMEGEVGFIGGGALADVSVGTTARTSFVLDTGTGVSDIDFVSPSWSPSEAVVSRFLVSGAKFMGVRTTLGSNDFFADFASGNYEGVLSSPANGDDYDLFMSILAPQFSLSLQNFNTSNTGGVTASELGADPLTILALGFDRAPAFTNFRGDFGLYGLSLRSLLVREVPEPSSAALFATGLLALGMATLRRRSVRTSRADRAGSRG